MVEKAHFPRYCARDDDGLRGKIDKAVVLFA
jgi:hypothetical protein